MVRKLKLFSKTHKTAT